MLTGIDLALTGLAACAAGIVNALAGGGTLISFPVLVAIGVPEVTANMTNTVALCPGYLGGLFAQKEDLIGQERRLWLFLPVSIIGGITGGIFLTFISDQVFMVLVPFLILLASLLLAIQNRVRVWIKKLEEDRRVGIDNTTWALVPVSLTAIYGGYFGAGQSVITLSVLGLFLNDTLNRLNALKQYITLCVNVAAAVFFFFSGMILWSVAAVMAVSALVGGVVGGHLAGLINPDLLRWTVVIIGIMIGIIFIVRLGFN